MAGNNEGAHFELLRFLAAACFAGEQASHPVDLFESQYYTLATAADALRCRHEEATHPIGREGTAGIFSRHRVRWVLAGDETVAKWVYRHNNSGSLAMLAAMRRASSRSGAWRELPLPFRGPKNRDEPSGQGLHSPKR
jgi:hypothetical protein